jgi:MFS transporter, AAHS family, 4-hydroxybenzoate transporter
MEFATAVSRINHRPVGRFQIVVAALCFLVVAIDGFDTAAIGFLVPAIGAQWSLTPIELAPLFGAGLLGLMLGAFLFGPLADKFGRKPILVVCVSAFGLMSLASSWSTSLAMVVAFRLLTGLGLGGAMPNAVTLTSEYCPERHRLFLVTAMFCGFTLGSALGGLVSAQIVTEYGWREVLVLGGVLPLALAPVLLAKLPESARFLVVENRPRERIVATLARVAPEQDFGDAFRPWPSRYRPKPLERNH